MDLAKLAGSLLNSDSIEGLSSLTGASGEDVSKVLTQAIPSLLGGAKNQAQDSSTAKGFAAALSDHTKDDTSDLRKFLSGIDMEDGSKIICHLLGSDKENVVKDISRGTGVSSAKTNNILSAVAPLLMSLLGQQTKEDDSKDSVVGDLLGSLLDNVDVGSLLTGLLTDNSSAKQDSKKEAASGNAGKLIGSLLGGLLKK